MSRYPFTTTIDVEALKRAHRIETVVSKYLPLMRKGSGHVALCPFHPDKHPSLRISPNLQIYHCFACGAKGDVINFVQEIEHCTFVEAVQKIAGGQFTAPVVPEPPLPDRRPLVCKLRTEQENAQFLASLLPYDPGDTALEAVYRAFGVGISPMCAYDRYKTPSLQRMMNRVIFPLHNAEGGLTGFAARRIGDQNPAIPKYLNTALSDGFDKSATLYGLHHALPEIRRTQTAYIVEGYKDALALHAAGITNCVALCGTAFTPQQVDILCSQARQLYLVLDGDVAGLSAAVRIQMALRDRITCHKIRLDKGLDPDELFRRVGAVGLRAYIGVF